MFTLYKGKQFMKQVYRYTSWQSDVVKNSGQDYRLPETYEWTPDDRKSRIISCVLYRFASIFSHFYALLVWNLKVVGREKLKQVSGSGYFIYGNHTQPFGDVVLPVYINRPARIYTIASQANYGIPVIGKILPYLGALPVPDRIKDIRKLQEAVRRRYSEKNCIVIFPEAHVWPYYTEIRPYDTAAFHYPAELQAPVFAMTVTYQKRKIGKLPGMTVYIDGPFLPPSGMSRRDLTEWYRKQVKTAMDERSKNSSIKYCIYEKV